MTNKKSTKRMLLSSALALFLCFLLLLGTTYAWFTDSVTSANNIIKSGTFDVSMEWADGTKAVPAVDSTDWKDASAGAIFNSTLWEPGYVEVRHIKIANEGTLALKYQLSIVPNGDVSDLSDVIDVYYVDPAQQVADRTALNENNKLGTLTQVLKGLSDTASGNLKATENHTVTLALKMREDAGNEYENKSIGSSFSIVLLATQLTAEPDSFDDQYDKDSLYPEVSIGNTTKEENEEAAIKTEEEDVKVDIPAGAPAGNYSLEVTNKSVETDASGNTTLSMDINLKKDGVKVAADGSIVYAVSVDIGAGLNLTKLIHDGVEISQFDYNPATGIVEFNVTHFSPFSFEYRDGNYAAAANGIGYANLNEAIAAGGEVILLNDVALEETITIPAGAVVTVDLNGHTISHEKECTASYSMISNKGTLTVKDRVGGGKISFTDTGAGDPSFGWGSYTVANYGTLTVDGGTIEHLGTQNEPGNVVHMICAIWQYSGTTTINNGTISCPNYRSVRLWKGEMVINGGDFKGQVWVQAVDNTSVLTVNGGTFAPSAGDMSSLFITNSTYTVTLSITDGNFTTKVGMNKPIQCITGGTFAVDPSAYVAPGYEAAEENGVFTVQTIKVAEVGGVKFESLEEAVAAAKAGDTITVLSDTTISSEVTLPAGITLNGNGKNIEGAITADGDLTILGHTKVTSFSAGFYNHIITIGEGACLEVTGTGRMTLGWGNTFNITGTVSDAKNADKADFQASLIVPGGISITGSGATLNVTNAYVKLGLTTSKNSGATDNFDIDFTNSIVDFSNNFGFATSTSGKTPVFDIDVKDSVLNMDKNFDLSNAACDVLVDNSVITVGSSMRNDGTLKMINGSEMTVKAQIQSGEHGGNNGSIIVDSSKLTIECSSVGHAMDGNNVGKLELINGATADIDYIIESEISLAAGTSLTSKSDNLSITTDEGYVASYENGVWTVKAN